MDRRRFLLTAITGFLAAPIAALGEQTGRLIPRVGILGAGAPDLLIEAFRRGLGEFGWVEGQNISLEYRFARGQLGQLAEHAADLVRLKVKVIFAPTFPATLAARNATQSIPIVAAGHADFVQAGLVTTLARPGGNVTGITTSGVELGPKRLELLKESIPRLVRVAILRHPDNPVAAFAWKTMEPAGQTLGLQLQPLDVHNPDDFDAALRIATAAHAEALLVLPDPMIISNLRQIADLATQYKLPAMFEQREFVDGGGLISYGANSPTIYRRAAYFIDKILNGAKPADLPIEQPTKFELVINLKTAKTLGLAIPPSLLARADQVIE